MKTKAEYNKLRGGYYTPSEISKFIAEWAIDNKNLEVLEPSCGDGSFIKAATNRFNELGLCVKDIKNNIIGIELDKDEALKAEEYGAEIINSDFFTYYEEKIYNKKNFDVILGNPPFIRYQNFNNEFREIAFHIMQELGFKPNKLTNIWLPFLILSAYALNSNGKLGMIIPAELFQVDYAAETRSFLSKYFKRLTIITFKKLLFKDAQQEVVVLLGEKESKNTGIQVIELDGVEDLNELDIENIKQYEIKELDHDNEKWIKYYLNNEEINLIRRIKSNPNLIKTTELFETNVGLVSGQNEFFIIEKEKVDKYNIAKYTRDIIGRSEHVKGIIFNAENLKVLENDNKKVFMFTPRNLQYENLSIEEQSYIDYGEANNYNAGYKCRIRKLWYVVPQTWNPEAFVLRQVHTYPKIVLNKTNAATTDTLHKIKFKEGINHEWVACAFINSFTFALSEITGRSYGGGVLTFEPGEIRKLLIPMNGAEQINIDELDEKIRANKVSEALDLNDEILLKQNLGLSENEILMLRKIWERLRDRRINRKKGKK